jgi:hypothetical protein
MAKELFYQKRMSRIEYDNELKSLQDEVDNFKNKYHTEYSSLLDRLNFRKKSNVKTDSIFIISDDDKIIKETENSIFFIQWLNYKNEIEKNLIFVEEKNK